jgi:hypothetical protein
MSETETTPGPKISVSFERKIDLGNYQNATASAFLTVPLDADASSAVIEEAFREAFQQVKSVVYDELGIEVTVSPEGVVTEVNKPVVTVAQATPARPAGGPVGGAPGSYATKGLKVMNERDMKEDIPDWLVSQCAEYGITAVWANDGKYGPFYKEAVAKGESPLMPTPDGKPGIISKPK